MHVPRDAAENRDCRWRSAAASLGQSVGPSSADCDSGQQRLVGRTSRAAAVELDHVSKRYAIGPRAGVFGAGKRRQELWALRDVSLRVEAGESVGLIGHNGAGKTTVLRLLAGVPLPARGPA